MANQLTVNSVRQIVREEVAEIKEEQRKQGVLLEDLTSKFDKNIDLLTAQMDVKKKVNSHEERIGGLEAGQKTIKKVVQLHSEQLAGR